MQDFTTEQLQDMLEYDLSAWDAAVTQGDDDYAATLRYFINECTNEIVSRGQSVELPTSFLE